MIENLPLLAKILREIPPDEDSWEKALEMGSDSLAFLEVSRTDAGVIRFGVSERLSADGERTSVLRGCARLNDDGSMMIEAEDYAAYQSFVEASRAFFV